MQVRSVPLGGDVVIGGGNPLVLIAGPCVIESEAHARKMALALKGIASDLRVPFVFKSSYDKANRSAAANFRGPGFAEGLRILRKIRGDFGVPVLSDIHSPDEAEEAGRTLDVLQIPAFLCRQTDLLLAAGRAGKAVNVKKGQFAAPWDMKNAVEKVESAGNRNVLLTERGATFGYNNLVSDMRALPLMRLLGVPVIFDATHSVQLPGGQGASSGGDRDLAPILARAAAAAGIDGLFLEVHDNPDAAPCDGPNMIRLADLRPLLETVLAIDAVTRPLL